MKRIISLITALALFVSIVSSFSFTALAYDSVAKTQLGSTDTYYQYDSETQVLTISGTGATPNYLSNGQGQPWYDYRDTDIKKVIINEGITSLGNNFLYQVRATEISLPSTLKSIGQYALSFTLGVTEWELPFGVEKLDTGAFRYCSTLQSITLPDTLTYIGIKAFEGCTALTEITIPYSVSYFGTYAFYNSTALSRVNFQSSTATMKISDYCFLGCTALKELKIPMNATVGKCSFGYKTTTSKYTGTKLYVYPESSGYSYAVSANISRTLFSVFDAECGIEYSNSYDNDNLTQQYEYSFIPKTTQVYNLYTRGDCDTDAVLTQNGNTIASASDISEQDRSFCITKELVAGTEYILTVNSVKSVGDYTLWIYPDRIASISSTGKTVTANAVSNMKTVDDSLLEEQIINIRFNDETADTIYYKNDFFNGKYLRQKEANLTCGDGFGYIEIGNAYCSYPLFINHSYTATEVDYTVDEDGYTLNSCVLCDDYYKENYTPTPAIKIKGRLVFSEGINNEHSHNKPYTYIDEIVVDDTRLASDRYYNIDENGYFTINTFNSFDATIKNQNGKNICFSFSVDGIEPYTVIDYGTIAVNAYDFNNDGKTNAKDYAIFKKQKQNTLPNDYMEFFANNLNR